MKIERIPLCHRRHRPSQNLRRPTFHDVVVDTVLLTAAAVQPCEQLGGARVLGRQAKGLANSVSITTC